jgi:hypothetical protein
MKIFHVLAAATAALFAGTAASADELVTNGDFSAGMSGFTSTYGSPGSSAQGSVYITTNPAALCGCFVSFGDHTSGSGNMLLIDGAEANTGAFWSQTFAVAANSAYTLSVWASNAGTTGPQPVLRATINGVNAIPATAIPYSTGNTATTWQQYTAAFNSGAATSVTLSLFDDAQVYAYNDFVVDDISFVGPAAVQGVPEPATWAMMILGFGAVAGCLRRRAGAKATAFA